MFSSGEPSAHVAQSSSRPNFWTPGFSSDVWADDDKGSIICDCPSCNATWNDQTEDHCIAGFPGQIPQKWAAIVLEGIFEITSVQWKTTKENQPNVYIYFFRRRSHSRVNQETALLDKKLDVIIPCYEEQNIWVSLHHCHFRVLPVKIDEYYDNQMNNIFMCHITQTCKLPYMGI